MAIPQEMPQLPDAILHQVILVQGLAVLVEDGTGNKAPVIIEVAAAELAVLVKVNADGIAVLAEVNLGIFLPVQHGDHHEGRVDKFYPFRPF